MEGRKILLTFCIFILLNSTAVSVLAVGISKEQIITQVIDNVIISKDTAKQIAIKMLKESFNTKVDEKNYHADIRLKQDDMDDGKELWQIEWYHNSYEKNINIYVEIDAVTGRVKGVSKHEYLFDDKKPVIASITEQQAQGKAESFIRTMMPDVLGQTKRIERYSVIQPYEQYGQCNYHFKYIRQVNSIPFEDNYITVIVDGQDGSIISYYCEWDEQLYFPTPENIINTEEAFEMFKQELEMKLAYIPVKTQHIYPSKPSAVKLVYIPTLVKGQRVDANTGMVIDEPSQEKNRVEMINLTQEQEKALIEKKKDIQVLNKELNRTQAKDIIGNIVQDIFGKDYKIDSIRYIEGTEYWETRGRKAWTAHIVNTEEENMYEYSGQITIDAFTQQIIEVYRYSDVLSACQNREDVLTWEQAYNKAINSIIKYFPNKLEKIQLEQIDYEVDNHLIQQRVYFNFPRIVQGVKYADNSILIAVNRENGDVTEIRCNWDQNLNFPNLLESITLEEAQNIFYQEYQPTLIYALDPQEEDNAKRIKQLKLVYLLTKKDGTESIASIDALTAKFNDPGNESFTKKREIFKKNIQGHWAEKELDILAFHEILDMDMNEPDNHITVLQFLKMLVNAKGYNKHTVEQLEALKFTNIDEGEEFYGYLQMAVKYGLIENQDKKFDRHSKMTREQMIKWLMCLLQYEVLAQKYDIFVVNAEDADEISDGNIGYMAIAKALGVIEVQNEKIRPKDNVTIAEAAISLYKVLMSIDRR